MSSPGSGFFINCLTSVREGGLGLQCISSLILVICFQMMPDFTEIHTSLNSALDSVNNITFIGCVVLCFVLLTARKWYYGKVSMDCWFCGFTNHHPRHSRHWWKCTECGQYNGFNSDGGYANDVPEMYRCETQTRFCDFEKSMETTNILCGKCIENQRRFVEALSDFNPSDDRHFDKELEQYRQLLDQMYGLCLPCKIGVDYHLKAQDKQILEEHNNSKNDSISQQKNNVNMRKLVAELGNYSFHVAVLYKLLHAVSMGASHWLSLHNRSNFQTDVVLFNTSFFFIAVVLIRYFHTDKYDIWGLFISICWLIILGFGNFKTLDSRYLRSIVLSALVVVEGIYLSHELLSLVSRLWKSFVYKHERRQQVEHLKRSPKPRIDPNTLERKTKIVNCTPSPTITNKEMKPTFNRTRRPSTPDLLEGHLDAMFIQRKSINDSIIGKDTNHVVSALKYRGTLVSSAIQPRVPGQVLKPATFFAPSTDDTVQTVEMYESMCDQPMKDYSVAEGTTEQRKIVDEPKKHVIADHTERTGYSQMNYLVIFFVLSILTNLVLVYYLVSVN